MSYDCEVMFWLSGYDSELGISRLWVEIKCRFVCVFVATFS